MKLYRKISVLAMAALVLAAGFTSCSEDDLDTNQYNKSGVNILGFGPMPITRGATMRVTGTQLNQVKEVLFPEGNQKLKRRFLCSELRGDDRYDSRPMCARQASSGDQ